MLLKDFFLFGDVALMALVTVVGCIGLSRWRVYLYRTPPGEMAFRRPLEMRVSMGTMSIVAFTTPIWVGADIWRQHDAKAWAMFPILILMCLGGSLLFFYASGPADLYLDTERRTYRVVRGWPPFARTRSGPWKDIWGVWIGCAGDSSTAYLVGITWWGGGGSVTLGRFLNKDWAERFAEEMMSKLGSKWIMPPRHLRLSHYSHYPL